METMNAKNRQINQDRIIKGWEVTILILVCIGFSYLSYSKHISEDNMNYAIEEIHQYDNELFANNIGLLEADYSPRYYSNAVVSCLMSLFHCDWAAVGTLIIRINYILYGLAAAIAASRISQKNRLLYGLLLLSCINRNSLGNMAFGLSTGADDLFLGTGIPLSLLCVSFATGEKKNWILSWICLALAGIMHVHEGMWGGATVGVIWLAVSICDKKADWKSLKWLPLYVVSMLLVTVPSLLHGKPVDNNAFVNIYAYIRTPHHLLPSSWGMKTIILCTSMICIPAIYMILPWFKKKGSSLLREDLFVSVSMIVLWFFILGAQTYAAVINPNATLITMYMTKCFKYITFAAMLSLLKLADNCLKERAYANAILLIGILICGHPYYKLTLFLFVLLVAINLFDFEKKLWNLDQPFFKQIMEITIWILVIASLTFIYSGYRGNILFIMHIILFAISYILPFLNYKRIFMVFLSCAACATLLISANGRVIRITSRGIDWISGEECLKYTLGEELYQLSMDFQKLTETDDEFLADPYNATAGWVQLVSQRNCYALFKCTPSSKKAVIDWYDRILSVSSMEDMNGNQLANLLREIKLEYVLIFPNQYDIVESSGQFDILQKYDTAAMYKLKRGISDE